MVWRTIYIVLAEQAELALWERPTHCSHPRTPNTPGSWHVC